MSWEIGVSTGTFYPFQTMEDALIAIADEGFNVVELFVQTPSEYTVIYGRRVFRTLLRTGMRLHSIHLNSADLDPFSIYEPRSRDADRLYRQALELGHTTGARVITWHGARRDEIENGLEPERVWDVVARWHEWAQQAEMTLTLENVSWGMLHSAKNVQEARAQLPNLCFTFDTFHSVEGGTSPIELLQAMHGRIATVHVSDFNPYGGRHLVPGRGLINWPVLLRQFSNMRFNGPLIIELSHLTDKTYHNALNESRGYLEEVISELKLNIRQI